MRTFSIVLAAGLQIAYFAGQFLGAQQPKQVGHPIRINVGLVGTDMMVFDRNGKFVENLRQDQFELRVDGVLRPVSFLESVSAGAPRDMLLWGNGASAFPSVASPQATPAGAPNRNLLFFIDDWHLSADSTIRTRDALSWLIKTSASVGDKIAVLTASGSAGSSFELSGDRNGLLSTIERINFQSAGVEDATFPAMTETQAVLIEQGDEDAVSSFIQAIFGRTEEDVKRLDDRGMLTFDLLKQMNEAKQTIRKRASALAQLSAGVAERTLDVFQNALRSLSNVPGRKLVFYVSDGFVLQPQRANTSARIAQVADAAAQAGIVVCTLDARGLVVGLPDAKSRGSAAPQRGRLSEISAPQDALNALAAGTGGRFLKNTNALGEALKTTLGEYSKYYVLYWAFEPETLPPGKRIAIRVSVKGRPELIVRLRQGSIDVARLIATRGDGSERKGSARRAEVAPPPSRPRSEREIYDSARTVIDLTRAELLQAYPAEVRDLNFDADPVELGLLLEKAGERVGAFFRDFPKTLSKEQVRLERISPDGRVEDWISRNYLYSFAPSRDGTYWSEDRTETNGRPVEFAMIKGYSLAAGRAGISVFLHPGQQSASRFRYLGRQASHPEYHVIAFAQKPERERYFGSYQPGTLSVPARLLYQGLVWVDSRNFQIVRMRTDLLAPRNDVGLLRETSEITFAEVKFQSIPETFWLPKEVVITDICIGRSYRNRHRYSDYQVFLVESREKIILPAIKKKAH
jgi:VWFA-related protein